MLTEEQKSQIKMKIDQKVKLSLIYKCQNYEAGDKEPHIINEEREIIFLGIYGLKNYPLFILGKKENKEMIWRNINWITWNEDRQTTIYSFRASIQKVDELDVSEAFESGHFEYGRGNGPVAHLFGYRPECTLGGLVNLNWGTNPETDELKVIEGVKSLEKIV